jgi:hypothetical protein
MDDRRGNMIATVICKRKLGENKWIEAEDQSREVSLFLRSHSLPYCVYS